MNVINPIPQLENLTVFCDTRGVHVGRLDFSKHEGLSGNVSKYRVEQNEFLEHGRIGLIHATVGYLMDNLGILKDGSFDYLKESHLDDDRVHDTCVCVKESSALQIIMIPHAIIVNQYYRSEEAGFDIGREGATKDFYDNRAVNWAERFRKIYCGCICSEAPYCRNGQKNLQKLLN